jgi:hypothetical protein
MEQQLSVEVSKIVRVVLESKKFVEYEMLITKVGGVFSLWFRYSALKKIDDLLQKKWKKPLDKFPEYPGRGKLV